MTTTPEKYITLTGKTEPIKEHLKTFGGKIIYDLSNGSSWIFPSEREEELCRWLASQNIPFIFEEKSPAFLISKLEEKLQEMAEIINQLKN